MIIPSIDLSQGRAVQLRQGKEQVLEVDSPIKIAEEFKRFGPLALIDLDAARGTGNNTELIAEICALTECRVGGGIRSIDKAQKIIELGASRIIIGTALWEKGQINHKFLQQLQAVAGRENIILALDCLDGQVMINGWKKPAGIGLVEAIKQVEEYGSELLITSIDKEGCLQGIDLDFFQKIRKETTRPITASGGVTTLEDIENLSRLDFNVQLGLAIYSGKIRLEEAFVAGLNWKSDLLPTIVSDEEGRILMLAWSSKESLRKTLETGEAWYFSRSRNRLWHKGESSGNKQLLRSVRGDCDGDTVKLTVRQTGNGACHRGSYSCFGEREFRLGDLYQVVKDRLENPCPGSYTAQLDDRKVREKILEEAQELIMAQSRPELIWEAADLIYFITVLLAKEKIDLKAVSGELARRRRKKSKGGQDA
ncbi:MAG TPA: phosphoribosyl-AMP cyclohydrolase [Candidatus Saccharicenans sp.]|nr:phosphoribosyl-AMP cyclohydrolase [Candidatus Saccharicenans sp.]HOL46406.1 phosphoribosyl-AMP cyclohydrolase [Candidatus Saccharicenans sp.]HPP24283.1 phosphoribosyl-AMP cyclohydrolase [Candidatus Saccharicenans sp.]